ncbi:hypothetical protein MCOR25_007412 [Pyricularia grisea]|uniref:Uncharacterized protein n=1 Tax=Pyricularia grisea TaxID=148305 RepID=A0A6P8BCC0_PYRGI|nr:uncharacterized protein PgNI_03633 [Pyricularia grisea]KAI6358178.1 hypothetical protein MCOR25_007412 [Pyricularia grisea]TLD13470.1 hypothetical protein PgNI_03633 [Pyricularia grisea]
MAIWLFRRRSKRRRSHDKTQTNNAPPFSRRQTVPVATGESASSPPIDAQGNVGGLTSIPQQGRISPSAYSFESGHQDEIHVGRKKSRRKSKRASAPQPGRSIPEGNPASNWRVNAPRPTITGTHGEKNEHEGALMEGDNSFFGLIPTLHPPKRDSGHLMSRKLSKRRKNSHDREREAELKAGRDFTPLRPATDAWSSGRPIGKDTRRIKSGITRGAPWEREHYSSDVSLPRASSIHSSLSSDSEQVSYRISALASLAPKPTLRYSGNPRWGHHHHHHPAGSAPAGTAPQRRAFSAQIPEATLKAHKRVDDLADDLNASDLRELMERDKRRRQRKQEREQEKLEKRLARRAERERQAMEAGVPLPNLERGVLGREASVAGSDQTSAVLTSSRRRQHEVLPSESKGKRVAGRDEDDADVTDERLMPAHAFHRVDSIPAEPTSPAKVPEMPPPPTSRDTSPKSKGFVRSKKSQSKSSLSEQNQSQHSSTTLKASESSFKGPMSWISIFKWGRKRNPGPSSFSNTSRDSMSTSHPPSATTATNVTFIPPAASGLASTVPKRTRSRFREDLPELPRSPRDSTIQPLPDRPLPPTVKELPDAMPIPSAPIDIPKPKPRHDTPTSMLVDGTSPEPHQSMSLASIDSEASWLSGGRMRLNRMSSQKQRAHRSVEYDIPDSENNEDDSVGIADDEYLNRVARRVSAADSSGWARRGSTGDAVPSSDDEDDGARWGAVSGRQPSLTKPRSVDRIKSREGLLNTVASVNEEDDNDKEEYSPVSPSSIVADIHRATSVNLGMGHARRISAGSAILLELSPRASMDAKRASLSPQWPESTPKQD